MPFTQWTSWMVVRGFSNQQLAAPEVGRSSELIVEIPPPGTRVCRGGFPEVLRILTLPEPFTARTDASKARQASDTVRPSPVYPDRRAQDWANR